MGDNGGNWYLRHILNWVEHSDWWLRWGIEYDIIISHSSEDDTMFTLYEHEPACVIFTLPNFWYIWETIKGSRFYGSFTGESDLLEFICKIFGRYCRTLTRAIITVQLWNRIIVQMDFFCRNIVQKVLIIKAIVNLVWRNVSDKGHRSSWLWDVMNPIIIASIIYESHQGQSF